MTWCIVTQYSSLVSCGVYSSALLVFALWCGAVHHCAMLRTAVCTQAMSTLSLRLACCENFTVPTCNGTVIVTKAAHQHAKQRCLAVEIRQERE